MPLPMIHLAIAVELYEGQKIALSPEFLLGSLAPDAIHMREGWTRADKRTTHLGLPDDYPDWTIFEPLLESAQNGCPPGSAFTAGYIAHILTDQHWIESVVIPMRSHFPADLSQEERRKLYYQESDQVDFNLYHYAPWQADVWQRLALAQALDFLPFLRKEEIDDWRKRTLHWFGGLKEEPGIEPIYYTDAVAADFIERAAVVVCDEFAMRGLLPEP